MDIVDEYILQRFPHKETGKPETAKPYECRICWHRNNYPTAKELSKICNSTEKSIHNYMSWYEWTAIKEKALELQIKQDQIDLRERQKDEEEEERRINDKSREIAEAYLEYLLELRNDPTLSFDERKEIEREIRETRRELSAIQRDKRTTEHLPNAYKDITADVTVESEQNITVTGEITTKQVLEENEDTIREFINRTTNTDD